MASSSSPSYNDMDSIQAACSNLARRIFRFPFNMFEGLGRVIPSFNPEEVHVHHQPDRLLTVPEEWYFLTLFERRYGTSHPFFYACQFDEVLKIAKNENKFVFVYLHAPDVAFTDSFCQDTLCSDLVIQFLDANFVCWGASVSREEAYKVAVALKATGFPFCAIVAPNSGDTVTVLQQVEGPVSPQELVEILQKTLEEQGSAFRAMKQQEEDRIRENRQLREEQDAAYQAALQLDREKDRARDLLREEEARSQAEAKKAKEEALQKLEVPKKVGSERIQKIPDPNHPRRKEASEELDRFKRSTAPKQPINKQKQTSKEARGKDVTTSRKMQPYTKILIRFPNGERMQQNFQNTDTIRSLYMYIDSLDIPGLGSYRLISNFPRRVYGYEQMDMTLQDSGLHPNATLFLELHS